MVSTLSNLHFTNDFSTQIAILIYYLHHNMACKLHVNTRIYLKNSIQLLRVFRGHFVFSRPIKQNLIKTCPDAHLGHIPWQQLTNAKNNIQVHFHLSTTHLSAKIC